jgi:hypothetical protein
LLLVSYFEATRDNYLCLRPFVLIKFCFIIFSLQEVVWKRKNNNTDTDKSVTHRYRVSQKDVRFCAFCTFCRFLSQSTWLNMMKQLKKYIENFNGNNFVLIGKDNVVTDDEEERTAWAFLIQEGRDYLCTKEEEELCEFHVCWLEYNRRRCRALLCVKGGKLFCRVLPVSISKTEVNSIVLTIVHRYA